MQPRVKQLIIILVILSSGVFYYYLTEPRYSQVSTNILQIIDGDTIDTDLGRIRLLGINTPEKNQPLHDEAMNFLKKIEGKEVKIELHGKDKYGRWLGYVFSDVFINEEVLKNGLANLYVYDKDNYLSKLQKAENEARLSERGIWKKSSNSICIELITLTYLDLGEAKDQEQLIINNKCNFSISVIIKDDANHIYKENLYPGIFSKNFSNIFNDNGDTLFVRDVNGLLLWYRY